MAAVELQNDISKDGPLETNPTNRSSCKHSEENVSRLSSRSSLSSVYLKADKTKTQTSLSREDSPQRSCDEENARKGNNTSKENDLAITEYENGENFQSKIPDVDSEAYQSEEDGDSVTNIIQETTNDNGMFYDATNMDARDVLKVIADDKLQELEELFDLFDWNKDCLISHADLKKTFISLGSNSSDEEITKMLSEAPKPLDFNGFLQLVGQKTMQMDPEEILKTALSKWDYDQSGLISLVRIRHDLMSLGDRFTEREVELAFEEANTVTKKGRTMIEYKDFCHILCGIRKPEDTL